ncbi:hypothetical protein CEXT_520781 [Caerostris extrusa]|uniref:Uncharacterized protein n=1 Tax=Caerostris extrusa TaxID=172846 RepID=A0AAV4NYK1_CAEEX|nr:hypothetical protein CEXT_520781 [Caerostris extrusa]
MAKIWPRNIIKKEQMQSRKHARHRQRSPSKSSCDINNAISRKSTFLGVSTAGATGRDHGNKKSRKGGWSERKEKKNKKKDCWERWRKRKGDGRIADDVEGGGGGANS